MNALLKTAVTAIAAACFASAAAPAPALAQAPDHDHGHSHAAALPAPAFDAQGIARTETVRQAFDSTRQAIQVRVDFRPGASFPKHSHPGVEIAYVLSGEIEYEMGGKIIRLRAGQSLYIPAGAVHSAKNIGTGVTSELATYLVEKDQPIVILDQ
ncbi:quercetin dioxygenase-like cupin family protein [Duganella sp. 3397]|uniref:cupin domain-containing protein n=1 Tax=Duganella sp. 3397 TaxID=2817732 RepID=UPI0028569084|nr:cupin domain-containing protein [Duganella sp. 3397]MDR7047952.1 quercetin dioxygenase-like cupin family protein [Duganella sp. 3397]